jgi:hypothetical protein
MCFAFKAFSAAVSGLPGIGTTWRDWRARAMSRLPLPTGLARGGGAEHKSIFFAEKDKQGNPIDYHAAVSGALQLVPTEDALAALADDYARMVEDGLLLSRSAKLF